MPQARHTTDRCEDCQYFHPLESKQGMHPDKGNCHRYPPTLVPPGPHSQWFPFVMVDDHCGEFKKITGPPTKTNLRQPSKTKEK